MKESPVYLMLKSLKLKKETALTSPKTLEEFFLEEIAKMQSKIKPEVFRKKTNVLKS
jgi:hypothetical protein